MIPCEKCGKVNPLGTRFCRGCGERLTVQFAQVMSSVKQTKTENNERGLMRSAREVLIIAVFLFICALGSYYLLVPATPPVDLPPLHPDHLLPEHLIDAPTTAPLSNGRLGWRRSVLSSTLTETKLSLAQIHQLQATLLSAVQSDGSVTAADALAATSLVALGLQACPDTTPVVDGARRARAWITAHLSSLAQADPTSRTLALYALIDADDLSSTSLAPLTPFLIDGKAPIWQALALMELPGDQRPSELTALKDALGTATAPVMALLGHPTPDAGEDPYLDTAPDSPAEARLLWAVTSWQMAPVPRKFIETMTAWSQITPPPALGAAGALCGATGPDAVQVLSLCTALRTPPVWLSH